MALKINQYTQTLNCDTANRTAKNIDYIVIHYTGAEGSAKNNCVYFSNGYRGASAHYFVGYDGEIWQSVADKNIAWHCGTTGTYYSPCRNSTSIGIEMCTHQNGKGVWYLNDATVKAAIALTKELMNKYDIPASNVIRHYDVTRKLCPQPMLDCANNSYTGQAEWNAFKRALSASSASTAQMYRVRKSWTDAKSQIGAFEKLQNAKSMADKNKGYYVFDGSGKKVYTPASSSAPVSKNTVTVKGKATYIRAEGHCKAKGLKAAAVGTKLTWLSDDGWGWSMVQYGNTKGWIQNSRLAGKSGLSTWRIATCNGTNVQVRADATTAGKSLGAIGKGKTFTVTCIVPSKDPKNPGTWIMTGGIIKGKDVYVYNGDYISIGGARK